MSTATDSRIGDAIREVTQAEVDHYQRNGWTRLPGLVKPQALEVILARLKAKMGQDAEVEVASGHEAKTARPPQARALFNSYENCARTDPVLHDFAYSPAMGRVLSRCAGGPVRAWGDAAYVKMPVSRAGGKTPWHQDWPYYPFDRAGSLTVWIALVDVPPEMGPMRFVSGSHLWGPQGRVVGRTDGKDTMDILPQFLRDKVEISPEVGMKAGDATVHDDMTIHSAPPNQTDKPRWAYTMQAFPADTLFTGCPQRRTDDLGLALNQPLEHANFPVLPT